MLGLILLCLMIQPGNALAGDPADEKVGATIVVEARRNMVVYVEKPTIDNVSEKISDSINDASIVGYVNSHARLGKVKNAMGIYEPVMMHTERVEVYDSSTINYAYEDCNYQRDAIKCAVQNDHYVVRTNISINDHEIVVRMTLYDSNALIVNTSSNSSREIVKWIKQQEINSVTQTSPAAVSSIQGNCTGGVCNSTSLSQPNAGSTITSVSKPKEELPIRFSIPPRLIDKNIHQASIGLFAGVKLN